jgi:hypothetical protein
MEGRQEVLDGFVLGPEIPVQGSHVGYLLPFEYSRSRRFLHAQVTPHGSASFARGNGELKFAAAR